MSIENYSPTSNRKQLILKAEGCAQETPDQAFIEVSLECLYFDVKKSKNWLSNKLAEISKRMVKLGVNEADVHTASIRLTKDYRNTRNTKIFNGYVASTAMTILVRDISNLDEIYINLLEDEELTIDNVSYHHSEAKRLENEAYLRALDNANELAEQTLSRLPESQKEIVRISNMKLSHSKSEDAEEKGLALIPNSGDKSSNMAGPKNGYYQVRSVVYVEYAVH